VERLINIFRKVRKEGIVWLFLRILSGIRASKITASVCAVIGRMKSKTDDLFAVYDLNVQSPSFNLVQFLLCVEHYCIKNGYQNYSVVIVPKELNPALEWKELTESYGEDAINYRTINLLSSLASLSPRCNGVLSFATRKAARKFTSKANVFPEGYGFSTLGEFGDTLTEIIFKEGIFCEFKVPNHINAVMDHWHSIHSKDTPIVTITIRNSKFDPVRNSKVPEWVRFAEYVESLGYKPIIIPDSDQPFDEEGLPPRFTDIGLAATYNMGIRLHLYQKAFVNCYVPNGPGIFAIYSTNINYIYMKGWLEGACITPSTVDGYYWIDPVALRPYWGSDLQSWNGDDDTFENIKKHFDEFCIRFNKKRVSDS
jgi:hypothetical protein